MQGVLTVSKNPLCKVGGRLDMTFADEICEVAEIKTTYWVNAIPVSTHYAFALVSQNVIVKGCI